MTSLISQERPIHFIGIGGIGMSALALILANRGHSVSGSDSKKSQNVQQLVNEGINVFNKQSPSNIHDICKISKQPPLVVISTAIPTSNHELQAAKKAHLEIWHRSDLLAALIKGQPSIAVAGSHGKTTTSTFITTLLAIAEEDPTAVIGGVIPYFGSNGHAGQGRLLIAEADESDGSLVKFQAKLGLITNLDLDHPDHYSNLESVIKTMKRFAEGCESLLLNYDCVNLRDNFNASAWWSIKTAQRVDFAALPISLTGDKTIAEIYEKGVLIGHITLPLPGLHNLSNAIAAIAACRLEGLSFDQLQKNIKSLRPPHRRFDFRGIWEGRQIVDDYAHHPNEIYATLEMARIIIKSKRSPLPNPPKRLFVIFQPHRYSRTYEFLNDFAHALGGADCLLLAPIYGAGEKPINGVNNQTLAKKIKRLHPKLPIGIAESFDQLTILLKQTSLRDDLVIAMGAGDVNNLWEKLTMQTKTNTCQASKAA